MRFATLRTPVAVALAATLLTGCAQSVDPIERLGKKAAQRVHPHGPSRERPYRHWGLTAPLAPAPKPSPHPAARSAGPGLPPVVDHVRTRDKVVFLTYDAHGTGADTRRDPRFADLVRELRLPVTVFPTAPRPGRFAGLPYATQRGEICGRHPRPNSRLLRPPHGTYDTTTRRAAADCGVSALVLWRASTTTGTLTYARGDHHLAPGDIVQVGPADSTARLLRGIQELGLTVGSLEDYL
ncbi:hypothetical protein [Streptomyces sp. N50]|uniref:hypothetical protein n=1 Tax=Streptomyces sp. N50 TaxID=3081765 RepID=UPI00296245C8|nr:hypothetical protein [Streptomyces sp. N50]WOX11926.1 hypothetical protein R2B38_25180 [Streptomyces sp. N50]